MQAPSNIPSTAQECPQLQLILLHHVGRRHFASPESTGAKKNKQVATFKSLSINWFV